MVERLALGLLPDRLFDVLLLWLASLPIRFGAWADDSRD
jgi:hypothetical protein